jgi:exosortase/archaeosortase family protein
VGLLYVYLSRRNSVTHSALLLVFTLPIALLANILRVLTLVLVTYYFGDAAGHGFHDYAGYAEIAFAFGAFFVLDALLDRILGMKDKHQLSDIQTPHPMDHRQRAGDTRHRIG